MFRKVLPVLLLAGTPILAHAQSTLTAANFTPVTTDAFALKVCNAIGITPGASGAAASWNFASVLTTIANDTGKVVACPSSDPTTHCSLYPLSNFILKAPGNAYQTTYYNYGSSAITAYGYYSATDTNIILSDPADQFRYPFTYGTNFSDTYYGSVTLGPLSGHVGGTVNVNCDAWGTLTLPGRTDANVLRVHTTQVFIDSVYLIGPSPVILSYTLETYSWYKPNYHSALMTIAKITETGSGSLVNSFVAYAPAQVAAVPDVPENFASLKLYPNPVQDELSIDYNTKSSEHVRITLLDITGREIAVITDKTSRGEQHASYNTATLPKGLYMARIQAGEQTAVRKVEIQ